MFWNLSLVIINMGMLERSYLLICISSLTEVNIVGQANRKIAETPMNQRSSRSHAVFSIYLTVKEQDSDFVSK